MKAIPGYPSEKIKSIRCPRLIIRGDNDPIVANKDLFELSELIKYSKLITIPNAGHVVFKDQREQFLLNFYEFMKHS